VPYNKLDPDFLEQVSQLRKNLLAATAAKGSSSSSSSGRVRDGAGRSGSGGGVSGGLTGRGLAALLRVLAGAYTSPLFTSTSAQPERLLFLKSHPTQPIKSANVELKSGHV